MYCKNCNKWEKYIKKIDGAIDFAYLHGVYYDIESFLYCPYCGNLLVENEAWNEIEDSQNDKLLGC